MLCTGSPGWRARPVSRARGRISLGVDEMALDVPQAILALITAAFDRAVVHELAGRGGGQRHGLNTMLLHVMRKRIARFALLEFFEQREFLLLE